MLDIPASINGFPVTRIDDFAFSYDPEDRDSIRYQLTSVIIPEGVTTIEEAAFRDNQLTSVNIPESVTSIGTAAFSFNQLTSVTIPANLTSIEDDVFYYNQLTNVTIPTNVVYIGDGAFSDNQLTNITIPVNVLYIGQGAFRSNQLTRVAIPDSVAVIGSRAFAGNQITSITIGDNTAIFSNAFDGSSLTNAAEIAALEHAVKLAEPLEAEEAARWEAARAGLKARAEENIRAVEAARRNTNASDEARRHFLDHR